MYVNELMIRGIVVGVFQENCYIIGNRRTGEAICVDPGDQPEEILALAKDMGVKIKLIANSHAHIDHILAVPEIQARTGARFLLHAQDIPVIQGGWQGAGRWLGRDPGEPPQPDAFIQEGDTVEVDGVQLKVVHTPGHTPGSVCLYTPGMLFSGDTLFRGSIGRTDFPGGDYSQIMRSIVDKLLELPDDTVVLPGHMYETTIQQERQTNPFILEEMRRRQAGRR